MRCACVAVLSLFLAAAAVQAQEACKMEMNVPAQTLSSMYEKAVAKARVWHSDVVPLRITNTSLGPLDEQGRSEAWNLTFVSPSANQQVAINTFRGMFTCYAMPAMGGRIPALKADFFRDGAKLYAIAKQKAGNLIAQGYHVSIDTSAAPETRHATWYLTFSKDNANAGPTIIVDANTGAIEKVLEN